MRPPTGRPTGPGSIVKAGWVVLIGLALAVAGAIALLSAGDGDPEPAERAYGEIRDDSREAMRELLREAEGGNR